MKFDCLFLFKTLVQDLNSFPTFINYISFPLTVTLLNVISIFVSFIIKQGVNDLIYHTKQNKRFFIFQFRTLKPFWAHYYDGGFLSIFLIYICIIKFLPLSCIARSEAGAWFQILKKGKTTPFHLINLLLRVLTYRYAHMNWWNVGLTTFVVCWSFIIYFWRLTSAVRKSLIIKDKMNLTYITYNEIIKRIKSFIFTNYKYDLNWTQQTLNVSNIK